MCNSRAVIEWNCDKRYLKQLAAVGIPLPDTVFIEPADVTPSNVSRIIAEKV